MASAVGAAEARHRQHPINEAKMCVISPWSLRRPGARPPQGGLSASRVLRIRAYVYIDGFNFHYGAVRGTSYKWLDFNRMCELLLPRDEIACIRYFTALVKPRPEDPQQGQRQQTFLRALRTLPNVTIHYGTFLSNPTRLPLARPTGRACTAEVIKTEE